MIVAVRNMRGLGDNIFSRAFVKTLARDNDVYLTTPWPEIFEGIERLSFMYDDTSLRTQRKNVLRQQQGWFRRLPAGPCRILTIGYGAQSLRSGSIVQAMQACFGVAPDTWDLPAFPRFVRDKPIAVVRPVTERREWLNVARNPLPEYVATVATDLMASGYHVVSVADLSPKEEWLVGDLPPAHEQFHAGELRVRELLGLVQSAAVVVSGVGWAVPACIAARTPLFCILGGHGGHNAPDRITDSRMDLANVGFAEPDNFCRCELMRHDRCDKRNTRLAVQWNAFKRQQGLCDLVA